MDKRSNILIIISDEHDPAVTDCYGHPIVKTPNMDKLAEEGALFTNSYCNSPICVPSRMSFITGRYCNEINIWDNGSPLKCEMPTFAHYFEASGYETVLCGRMHIIGENRLHGFGKRLYDDMEKWKSFGQKAVRLKDWRRGSNSHVTECGSGKGSWQEYDENVTDLAVRYLKSRVSYPGEKPWLMVAGFMFPHFPLICPERFYNMYNPDSVLLPDSDREELEDQHPVIQHLRHSFCNENIVPKDVMRKAMASYYGLISLTDDNIGRMLDIIDQSSLKDNTVVIYLSDHGEMAGQHGIWQKQCFYESAVRVPMIIRIPGMKQNVRINVNVSLVDIMPTIMELAGIDIPAGLPGKSLMGNINGVVDNDRVVFSEYHAQGMLNAGFMVKKGDYKYNYYVDYQPQLFNIKDDAGEFCDLAKDREYQVILEDMHKELIKIVDPEEVDRKAKRNQSLDGMKRAYQT